MRRLAWISVAVIVGMFLFITYSKFKSQEGEVVNSSQLKDKDKKIIKDFWRYYRQATKSRIAGDWKKATGDYLKALDINPQHEDALYYIGNMYLEQEDYHQAEKYWFDLLEIDPNSSRAHYQLGNIYLNYENSNLINLEKAEIEFKKALNLNKEETGSLLHLGKIYLLQEKDDLAKEYFTAVIGSNYTSVEAYFLSGYLAWAGKNQKEALSLFTNAIKYAKPGEGMGNADGEGATKEGKSLQRENQNLLFYAHIEELSNLEGTNMSLELSKRYTALEAYINQLKEVR